MNLLITFIILNIANVIIQTVKSIATIKCGKTAAALVNALAYGLYTWVIVMTNCELSLFVKCLVVAIANLIGVYVVKLFEEKMRKSKLWKVEATVQKCYRDDLHFSLKTVELPHNYIDNIDKYTVFNIYCATEKESIQAKHYLDKYNAKYFVSETKIL